TDVDSSALTYSIEAQPGHGTLTGTAPNVTYTPTTNYNGADNFTFKASDGSLNSNVATVSITVTPAATLKVTFTAHKVEDDSKNPKVTDSAIANALVRVFVKKDACPSGIIVSGQSKVWGQVFETCPSFASGTTDATGKVDILVPPTASSPNSDYVVIG